MSLSKEVVDAGAKEVISRGTADAAFQADLASIGGTWAAMAYGSESGELAAVSLYSGWFLATHKKDLMV